MHETDVENPEDPELDEETRESFGKFRKETDALSKAIDRILENVETVESRYKISLEENAEQSEKDSASGDIARLLEQTEKTSEAVRKRLGRIAGENKEFSKEFPAKTGQLRMRVNTHQGLTRRFMSAMQCFEESQEKHRNNVRGALERQLRLMNPQATDEDIENALRNGNTEAVVDDSPTLAGLPYEEQVKLRRGLEDLRSRNNDIKRLEESIIQLHQLFMDMQNLVEAQGELLNNVEYNIGETKGKTEAGYQELVEARAHQKSANKKKICIIVLIIVIILAISIPILVKYIPIWFPGTKDKIDSIPIFGEGDTNSTNSPQDKAAATSKGSQLLDVIALIVEMKPQSGLGPGG